MLNNKKAVVLILTSLLANPLTLQAQGMDLRETLREMTELLGQQQAQLETQRKELEEQRKLIRQLQAAQGITPDTPMPDEPVPVSTPEPTPATEPAAEVAQQPTPTAGGTPAPEGEDRTAQEQAKDALVKQQAEGPKTSAEQIAELQRAIEDPSHTIYNEDFPGAWYLPGTTAAMKLGGYVNLAFVDSFDPMLIQDRFIVGSIPPDGQQVPGAEQGVTVSADQTRINLEYREQTNLGEIRAFVEGDFRGDSETFRLRHAFGQFGAILAGKTWTTFMDVDARPEEVDVEGMNAQVLLRHSQIRWTPEFGKKFKLKLALEDPQTDVLNGTSEKSRFDLVASLIHMPLGPLGRWNYRIGFILRDLKGTGTILDPESEPLTATDSTTGWGITTSGRRPISRIGAGDDYILWQITYGEGIGQYINDLQTIGGGDAVFDPAGQLRALPVFAGYLSYQHIWPKRLKFLQKWPGLLRSNFNVGLVNINNYDFQEGRDYKKTVRLSANLMYNPTANVMLGVELLWGQRKNLDGSTGSATQLQVAARYSF